MNKSWLLLGVVALGAMLAAIACGDDDDSGGSGDGTPDASSGSADGLSKYNWENPKYGGTFRVMSRYATTSLDPSAASTGGSQILHAWVYEKLFTLEGAKDADTSSMVPVLAESATPSQDLKTWTIKLKKGIRWQNLPPVNGREFEAKDVVFTFEEYMKPTSVLKGSFAQIESVEATDKYTVTVKLKEPNAHLIGDIQNRQEFIIPYDLPDRSNTAIGTGPFMITSFTPGNAGGMKAVRNPNYWQKDPNGKQLPYIDNFEMITNTDTGAHLAAMRTGQVQYADTLARTNVEQLLKSNPDVQTFESAPVVYGTYSLAFKTENAPWSDQKVRCAISKAIDKTRVAQLMHGIDGAARGPFPYAWIQPGKIPTENDLGPCFKFDPEGAKKLLAEAGFGPNNPLKGTWRFGDQGEITNAQSATMQQMLKDVGIELALDRIDYTTFSTGIYKRDFTDMGAGFLSVPCNGPAVYACIEGKFGKSGRYNFGVHGPIQTPEIDAKLSELKVTVDPKEQAEILKFFWDLWINQVPEVPVRAPTTLLAFAPNVRNVVVRPGLGSPTTYCNLCHFVWFSDAPRTSARALDSVPGGGSEEGGEFIAVIPQALSAQRVRARVVRG